MSPYRRAWRNTGLLFAFMLATPVAVGMVAPAVGDWIFFAVFLAWIPLAFWLDRRVRCPECGTSPYVFGWGLMWSKPWPNARCAGCGYDLKS